MMARRILDSFSGVCYGSARMSRPQLALCVSLLISSLSSAALLAQSTQNIAPTIKTSNSIISSDENQIKTFLDAQIKRLSGISPAEQSAARDALAQEVWAGASLATPAFLDIYAKLLNERIMPVLDNPSMRVRLNAAIAIARVAEHSRNFRLRQAVTKLLGDKTGPVVLWGMKAVGKILPAALASSPQGASDPLLVAIVSAVQANPNGLIAAAAYDALSLDVFEHRTQAAPATLRAIIPTMQKVLQLRLDRYRMALIDDPQMEMPAVSFLVDGQVWNVQKSNPQWMRTSAQQLSDLLSLAAQQYALAEKQPEKDALMTLLKRCGSAGWVLADHAQSPDLKRVAEQITKLEAHQRAEDVSGICRNFYPILATSFEGLSAPPTVQLAPPASGPAATEETNP